MLLFSSENFLLVAIFVGFAEGDFGTIRQFSGDVHASTLNLNRPLFRVYGNEVGKQD